MAKPKTKTEGELREQLKALIRAARRSGYVMLLEIGKPAPHRQAISLSALYLRPLDGSDMLTCSCCANQYEDRMRSRLIRLPLNWCKACREQLTEGRQVADLLDANATRRKGCRGVILDSVRRVKAAIEAWGPKYQRELKEVLE